MPYSVKERFYSLQGEGLHSGRAAVFCRFAGCNLWSGRDSDRARALCQLCDTDFRGINGAGGGRFRDPIELADHLCQCWFIHQRTGIHPFIICTGGEPLLQLDARLIDALHQRGCEVAVETNGTRRAPRGIDWLTVSPKAGQQLLLTGGDELKLVYPQIGIDPADYAALAFRYFFLQPCNNAQLTENTNAALTYCQAHPQWRLSVQLQRWLNIP
ncbi:7-carboxy-7-deazaguanine synthase [Thiospirillum jenense]|uniref:7-carboxy-7-deazaguanine synthase n=1 Tax=Thiospirillum jenense TaxID=1653858 RepID=A0A839H643_9GAMM|nr:7-carboxy-7-deazaguanine synthase [Thiospirillum jenense]MBB1125051.1 7-carboxy-7-deazaguanine synthase [Thiospirillum jenense]